MDVSKIWFAAIAALILGCGCGPQGTPRSAPPLKPGETAYATTGIIRDFPVDGRTVVIRHEEIPGYMPRMTMTFSVTDPRELRGLSVGDSVAFRLIVTTNDHRIDSLQRLSATRSATSSPAEVAIPNSAHQAQLSAGQPMPDFEFLDEHGQSRKLSSYRGQAVAFTFIFTRCPLPDFCPRMSQHFAAARKLLNQRAGGPTNWAFLSLSFDPEFDRPEVLGRYARNWRGPTADRWTFAAISAETSERLAPLLDLKIAPEAGSIMHNLRTVVIDPQGNVFRQFDGNDWTPDQLADALRAAAEIKSP